MPNDMNQAEKIELAPPRAKSLNWMANREAVQSWVRGLDDAGPALLAIEGPTPMHRAEAYRWIFSPQLGWTAGDSGNIDTSWVKEGLVEAITQRLAFATQKDSWQLFHALIEVPDFVVEEPLRSLVDQGFRFTESFKAIWEARHLLQEGQDAAATTLTTALIQWMTGQALKPETRELLEKAHISRELVSTQDRLDMLFFLLALAQQNGLIDRTVVVIDSFELAVRQPAEPRRALLREALDVVTAAERWTRLGARVGIVFGFSKLHGTLTSLKRYSPKLHGRIRIALV